MGKSVVTPFSGHGVFALIYNFANCGPIFISFYTARHGSKFKGKSPLKTWALIMGDRKEESPEIWSGGR